MSQTRATAEGGQKTAIVTDRDGLRGRIDTAAPQTREGGRPEVLVHLDNGRQALVPVDELILENDGNFTLPFSLSEIAHPQQEAAATATTAGRREFAGDAMSDETIVTSNRTREEERIVMPVVAETLDVQKRKVDTGGVRIRKVVHEREEVVDEPLMREEVQVKRVPINRVVEAPVPVRHVGNTMIISLLEEVLVVEKRLMLKEELHITKGEIETYKPQRVTLRTEEAVVERVGEDEDVAPELTRGRVGGQ
ncbi:MAG TPA: YsnF/AvaK domain-containing protein [Pyrinomonadaceae bacterium]|nr:YsnF/AvaK domain-containing protein [Pyrinomonadaceae bacterium]